MTTTIRLAIAGVGNCASSLLQGIEHYRGRDSGDTVGLLHPRIGPYRPEDIKVVAAFDIDRRKVGRPLEEAVFAKPNCTTVFHPTLPRYGVTVQMAPVLDGVADHMVDYSEDRAIRLANDEPVNLAETLHATGAEVLVCYLPAGSERAVREHARACLDAGVAMVNCVPAFIASHSEFARKFGERGIPIVGDDIKSQFGATLLHRVLARTLCDRGMALDRSYQLNTGGNTDFLNMLDRSRLCAKRLSKTEAVQSQLDERLPAESLHVGPADYVPWQEDNKVCFLRIEWRGFGAVPMHLEARLSVEDSPNSAGVVIDAVRCARLALDRGLGGPIEEVSAFTMKNPPRQMRDSEAREAMERFIAGETVLPPTNGDHPRSQDAQPRS